VIKIPREFFSNGWLAEMRSPELLVFLISLSEEGRQFRAAGRRGKRGDWTLPREHIISRYSISRAGLASGRDGLGPKGLLTWVQPADALFGHTVPSYVYNLDLRPLHRDAARAPRYRAIKKRYARVSPRTGRKLRFVSVRWELVRG
jgi:hypothetical protein